MKLTLLLPCHNSARRLPETLRRIKEQKGTEKIAWEILLVDNASTDATSAVAKELLSEGPAPFRILHEARPGRVHALETGFRAARGDYVSTIDDDNWICPDWVARVCRILDKHTEVGVVGSNNAPVFETEEPAWFRTVQPFYACGPQGTRAGDITARGYLFGAGSTFRRLAWLRLQESNYRFFNAGRAGASLQSGEDIELCCRLVKMGWRLWYDPELQLQHFMTEGRLHWSYARRLMRGIGMGDVGILPYLLNESPETSPLRRWIRRRWVWWVVNQGKLLCKRAGSLPLLWNGRGEGDMRLLEVERLLGALGLLLSRPWHTGRHISGVLRFTPRMALTAPSERNPGGLAA